MDSSQSDSPENLSRKRKYLQPALVRQQVSEKRNNDSHTHRINKAMVTIGRGFHCDVKVLNLNVSRLHSILQQNNGSGSWSLTNVSQFETYVNNKALQQYENRLVEFGDTIKFSQGDDCTYGFCLIEQKDEDNTSSPPKMLCRDDDAGRLINSERNSFLFHQQQKQELEIEAAQLQDEYHVFMQKANDLREKKKLLTQQIQENTDKLMSLHCSASRAQKVLQDVKLDYENLLNIMKLQCEQHIIEEEDLPGLKAEPEWERIKLDFEEELNSSKLELENINSISQNNESSKSE